MRHGTCALVILGLGVYIGCGDTSNLAGVTKVEGTVTYKSAPIEGATVTFSPQGGGRAASGKTDASGRFQLTTVNPNDGALPGKYSVAISKVEDTDAASRPSAEQMAEMIAGGKSAPMGPTQSDQKQGGGLKYHLPKKYMDSEKSGLTAEVSKDGENDFTFALTD